MTGADLGRAVGDMVFGLLALAFAAGAGLVTFIVFVVPWAWGLFKPVLHGWTA